MGSRFFMKMKHKIVLIPFPFDDLQSHKVRPALCLTDPISAHDHVVVAFISSQVPTHLLPTDIVLRAGTDAFAPTGLKVSSVIRLHRMVSMTTRIIRYELGHIADETRDLVESKLIQLFNLQHRLR
ncbi:MULTISPECIES: type II toxin-antitoxin system PemK/MazF family toxin [Alicyclobacillus]|uniref:type II toxin-antitoxin system PemK/MazF family toxin n=2 Tax=Alicyclobacillaceae TaxID=186823 RepID=UPI00315DBF1B